MNPWMVPSFYMHHSESARLNRLIGDSCHSCQPLAWRSWFRSRSTWCPHRLTPNNLEGMKDQDLSLRIGSFDHSGALRVVE